MKSRVFGMLSLCALSVAQAQTGVSDDRVSLPEGPGSLEGVGENVSVSGNMGTMSWNVPIRVPQGFAGVTPSLSLNYDSGMGSGPCGVGWNLATPFIERNTYRGLPEYDVDDDFHASGAQLVRVDDAGMVYRARFEGGFVRYSWLDAGDGAGGYWKAEYPDGRVGYFGARADGTIVPSARASDPSRGGVFRYQLVEMVDVFDHQMVLDWRKDGNVPLLLRIGYVFTDPENPTYAVTFRYEDRADETGMAALSDARGGFDLRLSERLAEISVFSRGERIRAYRLTYEPYADAGGFTRLSRVETLGHRGGVYPIVFDFEYSRALGGVCEGEGCSQPFMVDMGRTGIDIGAGRATLIDINGDGLADLLSSPLDEPHRFVLNEPTEDGTSRFVPEPVVSDFGPGFLLGTGYVQPLDVNGDGFADLINTRSGAVLFNRGLGDWAEQGAVDDVAGLPDLEADFDVDDNELGTIRFLDIDHDKRIDILRSTRADTNVYRNIGGGGFQALDGIEPLEAGVQEDNLDFADMNGDGLLDPVRKTSERHQLPAELRPRPMV